jgi:hypothetical protein
MCPELPQDGLDLPVADDDTEPSILDDPRFRRVAFCQVYIEGLPIAFKYRRNRLKAIPTQGAFYSLD